MKLAAIPILAALLLAGCASAPERRMARVAGEPQAAGHRVVWDGGLTTVYYVETTSDLVREEWRVAADGFTGAEHYEWPHDPVPGMMHYRVGGRRQ